MSCGDRSNSEVTEVSCGNEGGEVVIAVIAVSGGGGGFCCSTRTTRTRRETLLRSFVQIRYWGERTERRGRG